MSTFRIMSGIALRGAFEATVLPAFEKATSIKAEVEWNPTALLVKAVNEGARADILVVTDEAIDRLAEQGVLDPASRVKVATGLLGVAVRKGAAQPKIETVEDFKAALLGARSVAYSQNGASGIYFAKLIEQLGVADTVRPRGTIIAAGFTAERLVTGEADLAVQQISELMVVAGVDIVGAFPGAIQSMTPFSAAVFTGAKNAESAAVFLSELNQPEARRAYEKSGLAAR